eukprot:1722718-Amphidinium_carterae.1
MATQLQRPGGLPQASNALLCCLALLVARTEETAEDCGRGAVIGLLPNCIYADQSKRIQVCTLQDLVSYISGQWGVSGTVRRTQSSMLCEDWVQKCLPHLRVPNSVQTAHADVP